MNHLTDLLTLLPFILIPFAVSLLISGTRFARIWKAMFWSGVFLCVYAIGTLLALMFFNLPGSEILFAFNLIVAENAFWLGLSHEWIQITAFCVISAILYSLLSMPTIMIVEMVRTHYAGTHRATSG